jgi:intracellular sulfur oxidation DsrE/DsrF family protein
MTTRRRFAATAGIGALAATPALSQEGDTDKVVYHLNLPGGEEFVYFRQFLVNLSNHVSVLTPGRYDVRVVMHGAGLNLLRHGARAVPQIAAAIDELKLKDVRFEICRITLRLNNVRVDDLYDVNEADLVESGVAQVARLQKAGFAYIKI